jgi:hypothetical protein
MIATRCLWLMVLITSQICLPGRLSAQTDAAPSFASAELKFFEQKIRPVLVTRCYPCHSSVAEKAGKLKGGLKVDSRAGLLRGGESGPAIVPGNSNNNNSLLIKALQHDSFKMPPEGKLQDEVISDFASWIDHGAADPRAESDPGPGRKNIDFESARLHWAYQPLRDVKIPDLHHHNLDGIHDAILSPIDAFIHLKLTGALVEPSGEASPQVLIRRLYFDLIGLPPSPDEIASFTADQSKDAYERLVDRLLASPHFGERWGRHWLSVVRFAESVTLRGFIFPEAWRYRDYVIETFNEDRPFHQFIIEQIAGDLLQADQLRDRQRQIIATTFLTLGNINLEEQDKQQLRMDVVDEQLEVIGKAFLAQTIGCARCHDHKFDPIPTRDYYALAGILANVKTLEHANVSKWLELPLPLDPVQDSLYQRSEHEIAQLQEKIHRLQRRISDKDSVTVKSLPGIVVDDRQGKLVGDWQRSEHTKPFVEDGYIHDQDSGKGQKTVTLLPQLAKAGRYEVRLAYTPGENRSDAVPVTIMSADGEKTIVVNQKERPPIENLFVSLGVYRFELNGQGFVIVSTEGTKGHVVVDAVQFLPVDEIAIVQNGTNDSLSVPVENSLKEVQNEIQSLQRELKRLQSSSPKRPRSMSVIEAPQIQDLPIHIRGTVHNLGESVPRGFLKIVDLKDSQIPGTTQSGRKELGLWIAHAENPLTSRVLMNRVWYWLYGTGLSRTPDNVGTTGEPPSHPELLDYLARRFLRRDSRWKPMIREIVLSQTYRRDSSATAIQMGKDPENRLLSHQNRRRLDAECLLDAILTVSGYRNDQLGGATIPVGLADDYSFPHASTRRAIYWPVFRNSIPEIFEAFDFADPSTSSSSRSTSTVSPQALFFLNNAWIANESRFAAEDLLRQPLVSDDARIQYLFESAIGRKPTESEKKLARNFLDNQDSKDSAWPDLVQSLFATHEFRTME